MDGLICSISVVTSEEDVIGRSATAASCKIDVCVGYLVMAFRTLLSTPFSLHCCANSEFDVTIALTTRKAFTTTSARSVVSSSRTAVNTSTKPFAFISNAHFHWESVASAPGDACVIATNAFTEAD